MRARMSVLWPGRSTPQSHPRWRARRTTCPPACRPLARAHWCRSHPRPLVQAGHCDMVRYLVKQGSPGCVDIVDEDKCVATCGLCAAAPAVQPRPCSRPPHAPQPGRLRAAPHGPLGVPLACLWLAGVPRPSCLRATTARRQWCARWWSWARTWSSGACTACVYDLVRACTTCVCSLMCAT